MPSMMESTTFAPALTISPRLFAMPSAIFPTSFRPAARRFGALLISAISSPVTRSAAAAISLGIASISPETMVTTSVIAVSTRLSGSDDIDSIKVMTISMPYWMICGSICTSPCRIAPTIEIPDCTRFGRTVVTSPGIAAATTGASLSASEPIPVMIFPSLGRMFSAAVPVLSTKLLISLSKSCESSPMPVSKFAHADFIAERLP